MITLEANFLKNMKVLNFSQIFHPTTTFTLEKERLEKKDPVKLREGKRLTHPTGFYVHSLSSYMD